MRRSFRSAVRSKAGFAGLFLVLFAPAAGAAEVRVGGGSGNSGAPPARPLVTSQAGYDASQAPAGDAASRAAATARPLLSQRDLSLHPLARLEAAEVAEAPRLKALEERNLSGVLPLQAGFTRALPVARPLTPADFTQTVHPDGARSLSALVTIDRAWGARLHLTKVSLPAGALLWTYGDDGLPQGPVGGAQVGPGGDLYAPSVPGSSVWISIDIPAGSAAEPVSFEIADVVETFRLDPEGRPLLGSAPALFPACLVDISCVTPTTAIDNASRGIGSYSFVSGGFSFVCTGGLLNDTGSTGTPFFLTANHCLSSQGEAITVETWWDYRSSTCDGLPPSSGSVQKSFGSTLLSSSDASDFTLLQLTSVPANRYFFGWTTSGPGATAIERVSNPGGGQQVYSKTSDDPTPAGTCPGLPLSDFLYEGQTSGAIAGGSSGSPSWTGAGVVVGQLFGLCGAHPNNDCDPTNFVIDGKFSSTFASIGSWLNGNGAPAPTAPSGLLAKKIKKFSVKLKWTDNATTEDSFLISQFDGANFIPIGTVPADVHKVKVLGLQRLTIYTLGVQACLSGSCSTPETQVTFTTK